jgi:hypothetical protein
LKVRWKWFLSYVELIAKPVRLLSSAQHFSAFSRLFGSRPDMNESQICQIDFDNKDDKWSW